MMFWVVIGAVLLLVIGVLAGVFAGSSTDNTDRRGSGNFIDWLF